MNEATYKVASELVPKVADEAANRAISSYIQAANSVPVNPVPSGLNIVDRKGVTLSQQEYERIRREAAGINENQGNMVSLGRRFEDALNQKINDEMIGGLVGNLFRSGNSPSSSTGNAPAGMVGGVLHELKGILDTKFGYGLGEKLGGSATELIKTIGQERVGQLIDNYNQNLNPNSQQPQQPQLTPEEQQKRAEATIMSFDSTNIADMTKFMEATGINSLPNAQKLLLSEQDRILQSRGLIRSGSSHQSSQQSAESSASDGNPRTRNKNKPNDMNRDLIDRYDNPNQSLQENQPFQSDSFSPSGNDFFSTGNINNSSNLILQQTPEERILSLNPDDPSSLHQYASMRNISGVDASVIKKMLMQEQRNLMNKSSNFVQQTNQQDLASSSLDTQNKNSQGISPDEDQARLRGGTSPNDLLIQTSKNPQEQQPSQQFPNDTKNRSSNSAPDNSPNLDSNTSDVSSSMDTIMRILNKLDEKIDYLESEITTLKSSTTKTTAFTDISPSEEQTVIHEAVNVDSLIKKTPRMASFNKTSKESEIDKSPENVIQVNTEKNKEVITDTNYSQDKSKININESETKEDFNNNEIKDLDWFGERSKIINDIKNELNKEKEMEGNKETKEHKKFTIKRR